MQEIISTYGYFGVFLIVGLESFGIPLPGETILITAAIYAGTTHQLNIFFVILAAIAGAIIGDNIGYYVGGKGGFVLLKKVLKVQENKLKVGQYLFKKYGGKVVFFGRFFSLLRILAAFLAGVNMMPWKQFLFFNAAGAIFWATFYGTLAYEIGKNFYSFDKSIRVMMFIVGIGIFLGSIVFVKYNEEKLEKEAVKLMPGPIEKYRK